MLKHEVCTAILNVETLKWTRLSNDGRGEDVTEHIQANVYSDNEKEDLYFMTGTVGYGRQDRRIPYKGMYRLKPGYSGWIKLDNGIQSQMGIIPVPVSLYKNNDWPKLDLNDLEPPSNYIVLTVNIQ